MHTSPGMNYNSRLTLDEVVHARSLYETKDLSYSQIAEKLNVSRQVIHLAITKQSYAHIDNDGNFKKMNFRTDSVKNKAAVTEYICSLDAITKDIEMRARRLLINKLR